MEELDSIIRRIESIKDELKINETDEKSINNAIENWVIEKLQNKLKEKGLSPDEK
ncbi:hypothetical protein ACSU64_04325 [Bacillaceae bacterium C204]|uniref:hypothetical protein n=1 Tax=Neobacillus sp. 204 TaxID=3383351 RepID=UPI00397E8712